MMMISTGGLGGQWQTINFDGAGGSNWGNNGALGCHQLWRGYVKITVIVFTLSTSNTPGILMRGSALFMSPTQTEMPE